MRALIPLIHQMFINISHPIIELLATSELKEIKIFFLNPLLLIFFYFSSSTMWWKTPTCHKYKRRITERHSQKCDEFLKIILASNTESTLRFFFLLLSYLYVESRRGHSRLRGLNSTIYNRTQLFVLFRQSHNIFM